MSAPAYHENPHRHDAENQIPGYSEKNLDDHKYSPTGDNVGVIETDQNELHRNLKGRHMQMIAM